MVTLERHSESIEAVAGWDRQRSVAGVATEAIKCGDKVQSVNGGKCDCRRSGRRLNRYGNSRRIDQSREHSSFLEVDDKRREER